MKVKDYKLKISALPEDAKVWLRGELKARQEAIEAEAMDNVDV